MCTGKHERERKPMDLKHLFVQRGWAFPETKALQVHVTHESICATIGLISLIFHQSHTSSAAAKLWAALFRVPSLGQTTYTVWPKVCGRPRAYMFVYFASGSASHGLGFDSNFVAADKSLLKLSEWCDKINTTSQVWFRLGWVLKSQSLERHESWNLHFPGIAEGLLNIRFLACLLLFNLYHLCVITHAHVTVALPWGRWRVKQYCNCWRHMHTVERSLFTNIK